MELHFQMISKFIFLLQSIIMKDLITHCLTMNTECKLTYYSASYATEKKKEESHSENEIHDLFYLLV